MEYGLAAINSIISSSSAKIKLPFWKMRYLTYTAIQKYFLFLFKEINTFIQDVEYKISLFIYILMLSND